MQFSTLFTILATALSLVAAQDTLEGTTTSTSTQTMTITITQCHPTVTNCPYRTNTTSTWYPVSNSTVSAGPTSYANSTSSYVIPTSAATTVSSTSKTTSAAATVSSSAAGGGLFVQSGLLMGVIGAGVALLA